MAGTSLLALIDDIATLLDDVSVMTKVAAKKTAGVLGDDLALNAQQVAGVRTDRELPVVWAVAKGSLINKAILVPAAMLISWLASWLIAPLMMVGGAFLCFEGFEKIAHRFLHGKEDEKQAHDEHRALVGALNNPQVDIVEFEREKIKGAIRTDFILSAEIVIISLGTIAAASMTQQITTLILISLIMTVGVYGLVAGIVKIDDAGLYLMKSSNTLGRSIGRGLLAFAPLLMKSLGVIGTLAMFLVGGGIIVHNVGFLHHLVDALNGWAGEMVGSNVANLVAGILTGALTMALVAAARKILPSRTKAA